MDYKQYLNKRLEEFENKSFEELERYDVDHGVPYTEIVELNGKQCSFDVEVFRDKNVLQCILSLDCGGLRSFFFPYSIGFEKSR